MNGSDKMLSNEPHNMTILEIEHQVEKLIDSEKHGLFTVLSAIAGVCKAKAEHIRSQDESTARLWENVGNKLDKFNGKTVQPFGI